MRTFGKSIIITALIVALLAFSTTVLAQTAIMPNASSAPGQVTAGSIQGIMSVEHSNRDIMTTLLSMNNAITARSIIITAGMDRELNRGSHTVFVPGNFAVRDIAGSQSQMNALTTDMRAANQIMQGLITNGMVLPGEIARGRTITMLNGKTLSTSSKDGTLMLVGARITRAIQATNGMIYVIDSMPGQ